MPPTGWDIANGRLQVNLNVLHMPEGRIQVPNTTTELYVEIGTNAFDTWDGMLPKREGAFLVAFEPLVDKWAAMLARGSKARKYTPLGHHHDRGIILPFAVSDRNGVADFHVSPRDGCSSLKRMHTPKHGGWARNGFVRAACAKTVDVRQVPTVTLRTVLGEWLAGWPVYRMKIDAQGHDLAVIRTAGEEQLARVREVSMEVLNDECDGIYDGQPNCSTVVEAMRAVGFSSNRECGEKRSFTQGSGCEGNFVFTRGLDGGAAAGAAPPGKGNGRAARIRTGAGGRGGGAKGGGRGRAARSE
tara:strand:+ start:796 stop:1698 length:903 start_codon:yes stop_codon:yes gene_type:complete